ncbi:DUF4249 domain-containing protein [Algoriphagus sediminis]|uniref:DUF4249 domain-containing protein n=1 Tax=Algoriphagus sediminis TaxID=3057113 RepID=A0ABT7YFH1_9BACT|nr:DUF4249 domain-containing protein [Algoriphagus sediminis]MDN3204944.1 DUF4249 domain-containing protein [Algoriphagus sediminis]
MRKIFLFALIALSGCIDPFVVEVPEGPQYLTIEGYVTTIERAHQIRITRGDTYGSVFEGLIRPVREATVVIRDNLGNVTFLQEDLDNRGSYLTPSNFKAEVGNSYTLQIQLNDGKVYTSLPEKVAAPTQMENVSYQSVEIPVEGEVNPESGVQFIVDINDPVEENNFYFWRNSEATYVLFTRPDLYFTPPPGRAPAPKDCCFVCWRDESAPGNQSIFIANDDNFNGLSTTIPAGFIPDNGLRFADTYRVDLSQISISQEAYRFLRLVKQQAEISGSVFDPPPARITGNMISLDDPDEVVLGYFMAGGETKQEIYIKNTELDFVQPIAIIPDDCRVVEGANEEPPLDWNP